jgi:hypothetical protein
MSENGGENETKCYKKKLDHPPFPSKERRLTTSYHPTYPIEKCRNDPIFPERRWCESFLVLAFVVVVVVDDSHPSSSGWKLDLDDDCDYDRD